MERFDLRPTVLLTADDPIVGLDLSDALERAGYRVAGPLDTETGAIAQIERTRPSLAVVDQRLRDGPSGALMRVLRARGVPFVIHADHPGDGASPDALPDAPWLAKPAWHRDVVDLLSEIARREARPCCR
ncbi:hypothetical protein [Methylobacterium oxalidis]|uniref:Response regulatory domain-containing protein n=1 Tax=Methylobacterium oxalidis TaxID=944322 RepID=A0A512J302_9HYPH|nr:hypothetical protein [Methylobacterium oxalidis]GEP04334.1 hypothetical protein MOX02_23720 [Methylobacterium oxalidis]GLS67147.1 hypothetical protein GCM10007888_55300 [Methylobacterium oxalidis]